MRPVASDGKSEEMSPKRKLRISCLRPTYRPTVFSNLIRLTVDSGCQASLSLFPIDSYEFSLRNKQTEFSCLKRDRKAFWQSLNKIYTDIRNLL